MVRVRARILSCIICYLLGLKDMKECGVEQSTKSLK